MTSSEGDPIRGYSIQSFVQEIQRSKGSHGDNMESKDAISKGFEKGRIIGDKIT